MCMKCCGRYQLRMQMAVDPLRASAIITLLSFSVLHWQITRLPDKFVAAGIINFDAVSRKNVDLLNAIWVSPITIILCFNFLVNVFILSILCLKTIFFSQLQRTEIRKMLERLFNYVIYKGAFLPLVVPTNVLHVGMWSTWLVTLSSLKMFQTLAKDRLERLNSSPSATQWTYFRVFSALLFVLVGDVIWICLCLITCRGAPISIFMLLVFEPLSIAFETLQVVIVHGFQLVDMWHDHSLDNSTDCGGSHSAYKSVGASLCEWKTVLVRNFGFILDTMTLLMALGHYLIIWWLHGMSFHLVDAILFLNLRALVSAIIKRIRGFIKLRKALSSLNVALVDATSEELCAYNDDCAICREPMSKAKKLSCNHLFHLSCLRSWLDQGVSEVYSCPTCRRPLFPSVNSNSHVGPIQNTLTGNSAANQQNLPGHEMPIGPSRNHLLHPSDRVWRTSGLDGTWVPPWPTGAVDVAGTSSAVNSGGLSRVQLMMRRLASVSESYAHGALEDTTWNFWPPQQQTAPRISNLGNHRNTAGLRFRSNTAGSNMSNILVMAERVREILPHIPDELIIQDLQRTNNATATVNNFLPT